MKTYRYLFLALILLIYACGGGGESSDTAPRIIEGDGAFAIESAGVSCTITATPSSIATTQSSTIDVTVLDISSLPVSDGTTVNFSLDNPALGTIPASATTTGGDATVSFTAGATAGTVVITAASGAATCNVSVNITLVATVTIISATPNPVTVLGTSNISVDVDDAFAAPVPDGTVVNFTLDDDSKGTIPSSVTTAGGIATASFQANNDPGTVRITAESGGITDFVDLVISPAASGSIQFISADPQLIGIRKAGIPETSLLTFLVKDENGNPQPNEAVDFTMVGPSGGAAVADGGEYIGSDDGTPTTASGSTGADGQVTVTLNSGTVAGPVTIIASIPGTGPPPISTSSAVVSIGGGVVSAAHFGLAVEKFNLYGFIESGILDEVTAFVADRFGNYNVLEGTSVSFNVQSGAIDASAQTDSMGHAVVDFESRPTPMPIDVAIRADEVTLLTNLNATYGLGYALDGSNGHPRDGWITILASVMGEEAFNDTNGNGLFDDGTDTFTDVGEPFIDVDDDGVRDAAAPYEWYVDSDNTGTYTGANGEWDGPDCSIAPCEQSKRIGADITIAYTGNATLCLVETGINTTIANGTAETYSFMVGDFNTNAPIGGTKVTINHSGAGQAFGQTDYTIPDGLPFGPYIVSITIADDDPATDLLGAGEPFSVEFEVSNPNIVTCTNRVIVGTVE